MILFADDIVRKGATMSGVQTEQAKVDKAAANAAASDKRFKILDAAIRKQQSRPDALITLLHRAQELFGYLDTPVLWRLARALRLPPSRVYGVATFYHLFHLKPQGEHTCVVCMGTACFVKGAQELVQAVEEQGNFKAGGTTADGKVSLIAARCIGTCGIAPAVVLDGQTVGFATTESLTARVKEWMNSGS
jgi:bidirectional [NiFe] hydrogenase diaphorase subunit